MSLEELADYMSTLTDSSVAVLLSYTAFSKAGFASGFNFIPKLTQVAAVPILAIVDPWFGSGIVRGYLFC
jgi:hypothetical protein